MTPDEIYGSAGTQERVAELCLYLIQEHSRIRRRDDYDTVSEAIGRWSAGPHRDLDDKARTLVCLCDELGLLPPAATERPAPRAKEATRGAVRTRGGRAGRGARPQDGAAGPSLDELLAKVAARYGG